MLGKFGVAWRGGILESADVPDGDDLSKHIQPPIHLSVKSIVRRIAGAGNLLAADDASALRRFLPVFA
jgi:hypothetical protein